MTTLRPTLPWGILLGLLCGCHPVHPERSVEGIPQACCSAADSKLEKFEGCRIPRRSCRTKQGEKFWMRGAVSCGPVDEANCAGGRCCTYTPQYDADLSEPIENWAPPGHTKPTNNVTDPNAQPQHDVPQPGAEKQDAPAEAPVVSETPAAEEPAATPED